jgi:methionyl-tRNA formyltransferase
LSLVFLGTSEFAAAILERLARSEAHRPALVLTRPDRPSGRGRALTSPPVAERARELGIALEQPPSVNDPDVRELIARAGTGGGEPSTEPGAATGQRTRQTLIVCAFGALVREPLLSEHDILNVHPSLLPRWRGAAPVERAIMAGDERTGVAIMRLTAGLDSGPVCLGGAEPIESGDTYGSLAARLEILAGDLLIRALQESPPFVSQDEQGVTYAEKIGPADRLLDPRRPAVELERQVRALSPHIGARVALADGSTLGVKSASLPEAGTGSGTPAGVPGEPDAPAELGVYVEGSRLLVRCTAGELELLEVQPPGGRSMDAASYIRGHWPTGRA